MNCIELIGPSGIGKTTFLKKLLKARGNANWITATEALMLAGEQKTKKEKLIIKAAGLLGLSIQTGNKCYLKKIQEYEMECSLLIEMLLSTLTASKMQVWQKVKSLDFNLKSVLYHQILLYENHAGKTILLDEGIVQNWARSVQFVLSDPDKYQDIKNSVLFPKAIIHFDLDDNEYRKRLISRYEKSGKRKINLILEDLSDEETNLFIKRTRKISKKLREACKCLQLPVLDLEPVASKSNIDKALSFISTINR